MSLRAGFKVVVMLLMAGVWVASACNVGDEEFLVSSQEELDAGTDISGGPDVEECDPETDEELCDRIGAECGEVSEEDNCGEIRSVDCTEIGDRGCEGRHECRLADDDEEIEVNRCLCPQLDDADPEGDVCERTDTECGEIDPGQFCEGWEELGTVDCGGCPEENVECGMYYDNACGCPCEIGDTCYDAGELSPDSPCQVCDPGQTDDAFTDVDDGTECAQPEYGEWSDCEYDGTCAQQGERSRTVTYFECDDGECEPRTETETETCGSRNTDGESCGDDETGEWSQCGFDSLCDEEGTRQRTVTNYECRSGQCESDESVEIEPCDSRDTEGDQCGQDVDQGECEPVDDGVCTIEGEQEVTLTDYFCSDGSCESGETTTETESCTLDTDGDSCGGDDEVGEWSDCTYDGYCDDEATVERTVTTWECQGGECEAYEYVETEVCDTRDREDGEQCGDPHTGDWSDCQFDGPCDNEGIEERTITTYECLGGECQPDLTTETRSCERDTEGQGCGPEDCTQTTECLSYDGTCAGYIFYECTQPVCSDEECQDEEQWEETEDCALEDGHICRCEDQSNVVGSCDSGSCPDVDDDACEFHDEGACHGVVCLPDYKCCDGSCIGEDEPC